MQFAGSLFRTAESQQHLKTDDSHVRLDYVAPGRPNEVMSTFATIKRLFQHTAYPGGPNRVIVEGDWFKVRDKCPVSGNIMLQQSPDSDFNSSSRFAFLDQCYQRPVAIWPHDPLNTLPANDPSRDWFDVIDRNQTEDVPK